MRTMVILWIILSAIIGCGDDEFQNSSPVSDYLIIPDEVNPSTIVEL